MQSGVDTASKRLEAFASATVTHIDVHPDTASADSGPSFRDFLDAINPLNHIPIVSDIFEDATQHEPSTLSKLVGGSIFGGPIGFVTSLAGVIYKGETGQSVVSSAYAALTGDTLASAPSTQVAAAQPKDIAPKEDDTAPAQAASDDTAPTTASSNLTAEAQKAIDSLDIETQMALKAQLSAPAATDEKEAASEETSKANKPIKASPVSAQTVLDLYGASPASAHASYRRAQLRPYLQDVSASRTI